MGKEYKEGKGSERITVVFDSKRQITKATLSDEKHRDASLQVARGELSPREVRENHEKMRDLHADLRRRLGENGQHL